MPSYIVTAKEDASDADYQKLKKNVTDMGGKIGDEYKLIKGFSFTIDNDVMSTLESDPLVNTLEQDGEVHTQG